MNNAELITALRCEKDCDDCAYHTDNAWSRCDEWGMRCDAADALEAAEKRIAELEEQHGKQLTRNIMLTAQLPREGEWKCSYPEIESNPMFMYGICSICGFEQSISNKLNYCPNCGARMQTVTDCHALNER